MTAPINYGSASVANLDNGNGELAAAALTDGRPVASWLPVAWRCYQVTVTLMIPAALMSSIWLQVYRGIRSRATDGSGHHAMAQIYDQAIFPDVFGWTGAYFGGMPFPNFYPPLFHWCVALLHHTHLVTLSTAFKLVMAVPLLLMPAAMWLLAWTVSNRNSRWAMATACASIAPLMLPGFQDTTTGLDYSSTLIAGFYTQPLGFVLLVSWYVLYLGASRRPRFQLIVSSFLLALTVLASFFTAITAALLIAATLLVDLLAVIHSRNRAGRTEDGRGLIVHCLVPPIALCLAFFWLAPMFHAYDYFVTRPLILPLTTLITPVLWIWYSLAAAGIFICVRRPTRSMWPFLLTLLALSAGIVFASTIAPRWFPLQAFRFFSMLNFLLAVPVGILLSSLLQRCRISFRAPLTAGQFVRQALLITSAIVLVGIAGLKGASAHRAFYLPEQNQRIEAVLSFAREHRDGRYLVEVPHFSRAAELHPDSPAISSYLGAQGNETLSVVYREASPNSIFFNALVNAFSDGKDSFGISSVLADDLDFAEQPLARHLEQASFAGVRYLVVTSPAMKQRLEQEPAIGMRHDLGEWTIFEMRNPPPPPVRNLAFKPALLVSSFSVKERRRNEYDFTRLAQEQFADNWFDVLLVRSPEQRIDQLQDLNQFGSLVLESYQCDDEEKALQKLQSLSREHPLLLLSSDTPLFHRIKNALSDFPMAQIVDRPVESPGGPVEALEPSFRYDSTSIRATWKRIRQILEQNKIPVTTKGTAFINEVSPTTIRIDWKGELPDAPVPVLLDTTFSPNWRRTDGGPVYAATPFFMLTFVRQPAELNFERYGIDKTSLWISLITLICLLGYATLYQHVRRLLTQAQRIREHPAERSCA